jgi:hypothetical protein
MNKPDLDSLTQSLPEARSALPPLEKWYPELSGDIDIRIDADGTWYHEGGEIHRQPLVNLFASILRREDDGEYYLVTPVEKWRIQVERYPLLLVAMDVSGKGSNQIIQFTTNTSREVKLGENHPLRIAVQPAGEVLPVVMVGQGLEALVSRPVYYQLADLVEPDTETGLLCVRSSGMDFPMQNQ